MRIFQSGKTYENMDHIFGSIIPRLGHNLAVR